MTEQYTQLHGRRGFTLLIAILVVGIVLAIGLSILNITLKEFLLSGIARESVIALNAADSGMECILYWDRSSEGDKFDVVGEPTAPPPGSTITCMGRPPIATGGGVSGIPQTSFQFSWGLPAVCAKVEVTKYYNPSASVPMEGMCSGVPCTCPMGVECTRVISLGYNKACSQIVSDPRTVERGLRARY